MVEELLASDQPRVVPAHIIYGALATQLDGLTDQARSYTKDRAIGQFRQAEGLHVTANSDRVKLGGTDKEFAILNPAALLEIEVLFGAKVSLGRWVHTESGTDVAAKDPIRASEPMNIAEYMRQRRIDAWGVILNDQEQAQKPKGDSAAAARHQIGEWPKHSKEFAEAWLKTGCGRM